MIHTEVAIVGAGPAGSACARQLKQAGVDCLLLDKQSFPRIKPCAGWITPAVVADLDLQQETYPHSFTAFHSFQISVKGLKFKLPVHQFAIRRVELDDWLVKSSGIPLATHQVQHIEQVEDGYVIDGDYHANYLVGAGGTYCPVRRSLFQQQNCLRPEDQIVAMEEEFHYSGADERCHLWFLENNLPGYAWYVPKAGGYVNVGVGGKAFDLKRNGDDIRRHWRLLTENLEQLGLVRGLAYHPVAHTYYIRHSLKGLRQGNAFLVGDAAGLATPDMGEGIGAAIRSGMQAAKAIISGGEYDLRGVPKSSIWSILTAR